MRFRSSLANGIKAIRTEFTTPGRERRRTVMMFSGLVAILAFDATTFDLNNPATLMMIFLISFMGFSFLAWFTFGGARAWRAVDYAWVFTTFVGLVMAVINAD